MSYEYHIGEIKKGDVICERHGSLGVRTVALEDGRLDGNFWTVKCENTKTKEQIVFAVDKDFLHYGPELYLNEIPYANVRYV
jgi:hypothetical protein